MSNPASMATIKIVDSVKYELIHDVDMTIDKDCYPCAAAYDSSLCWNLSGLCFKELDSYWKESNEADTETTTRA